MIICTVGAVACFDSGGAGELYAEVLANAMEAFQIGEAPYNDVMGGGTDSKVGAFGRVLDCCSLFSRSLRRGNC